MVTRKSFNVKFTAKKWCSDRVFYVTIANADIESLKSLNTFIILISILHDMYAGAIWTKSNGPNYIKNWNFWQKVVNHFWQSVNVILKDVSVAEAIVWC